MLDKLPFWITVVNENEIVDVLPYSGDITLSDSYCLAHFENKLKDYFLRE